MNTRISAVHKLQNQKMSRNAIWLIGSRIYQMTINLIVSMLTARFLGPANYGLINYAASLTALFTSLCTLGINSILVNELLRRPGETGTVLGSALSLRLVSSLCSVLTITALSYILNPDDPLTVVVVLIYSTTLILQCFDTLKYWYQAHLQSRTVAIITAVCYTAASVYKIALLILQKDVRWFAAAHVVEYALMAVFLLVCYCRENGRQQPLRFSAPVATDLLSRSYHFILSGLMVAIYGQMDRVMLKGMMDETAVGYYSAASAVCSMWPFVLAAIIDSAKPVILSEHGSNQEKFEQSLTRLYGVIMYVSIAAAIGLTLLSGPIIRILYSQAYMNAQSALCILCWDTGFSYLGVARSTWLVPQGKQKYEKYIAGAGAACNLLLNAVMIPRWGVNGAAAATLLTQIFTNFVVGFFFREIRRNNVLILRSFRIWRYWK